MTTILNRILETKRADVAARKACISMGELDQQIAAQTAPRGFRAALDARALQGPALIAEIKKASPSKGVIRENFDPPAHAIAYQAGARLVCLCSPMNVGFKAQTVTLALRAQQRRCRSCAKIS